MSEKHLTPTMEDYLETIFLLSKGKGAIRVKNIAKKHGVKMSSVTNMLKTLSERGFIDYEKHEYLELTEKGRAIGKEIGRRHDIIRTFLSDILKIGSGKADEEACKMEHGMSPETLTKLTKFMEFVQTCPRVGANWLSYFEDYCQHGLQPEKCIEHMEEFSSEYQERVVVKKGRNGAHGCKCW
jgi:DtxR family Mn-dependent transcriptional regulator